MNVTRTFDLLDHLKEKFPQKTDILCEKVNGEWIKYSSQDYYKYSHYLAYGFAEMGLKPGDKVITISPNCPEWNFVDMALAMVKSFDRPKSAIFTSSLSTLFSRMFSGFRSRCAIPFAWRYAVAERTCWITLHASSSVNDPRFTISS